MPQFSEEEGCKLFVYGVATQTPKEDLQAEFERFGNVSDAYNSGKGYAFITYGTKEEADQAKQMMNGTTVCGQEIKVDIARPRGAGNPRGGGRGRGEYRGRGRGGFDGEGRGRGGYGGDRRGGYGGGEGGYGGGRGGGFSGERGGRGRGEYRGRGRGGMDGGEHHQALDVQSLGTYEDGGYGGGPDRRRGGYGGGRGGGGYGGGQSGGYEGGRGGGRGRGGFQDADGFQKQTY